MRVPSVAKKWRVTRSGYFTSSIHHPLATIAPTRSRLLSGRRAITFSRGPVDLAMIETTAGREALDSNGSGCDGSARTRGDWSRPPGDLDTGRSGPRDDDRQKLAP